MQFLQTTSPSFAGNYDVSGLAPGSYLLTVRATDATNLSTQVRRTVIVTSMASLSHPPVFALPTGGQLLAAEGTRILYSLGTAGYRVRDLATGVEATLAGAADIQYVTGWQLSGGRAYAYGKGADCVLYCVYQWGTDGTLANLTNPNPFSRATNIGGGWAYDIHPIARDGYVVWVNDKAADTGVITNATGRYTVLNLQTGTYTRVGVPAGVNYMGNNSYDFAVVDGVVHFYYWAQTGGEGMSSTFDVFKWRSDTGVSTRLTTTAGRSIYPQTDGVRAAWQPTPVGGTSDNTFTLAAQPLSGGPITTASTTATSFLLRGGLLAWAESAAGGARAIKASTGTSTVTLSNLSSSALLANGDGRVAFVEQGRVYTFEAATGRSTLRVETAPTGTAFITGGALVFSVQSTVYRVLLN